VLDVGRGNAGLTEARSNSFLTEHRDSPSVAVKKVQEWMTKLRDERKVSSKYI
jgi:hypothetical protein